MQRYLTFVVLFLISVPVGLSIQGCANKNSEYCNGLGYGYKIGQPVGISLGPQTTGLSVAYSQTAQLGSPSASDCKGSAVSIKTYTYGTTDRTIADVSPTGQVCGGTWNYNTPGVASYTTCLPTNKEGVAYMTASADGFVSNTVAVYSHSPLSSLTVAGPQSTSIPAPAQCLAPGGSSTAAPALVPACLSQGDTSQLDATAYCSSTGPTGQCPSATIPAGQPVMICSPCLLSNGTYGPTDCNNVIGHLTYSPSNPSVVTIDQNGVATAQNPGSTVIAANISKTGSSAGYFYTCPAKSITLTVPPTGDTSASITPNTPQPLTATVTDVNNNIINGLPLTYVSTNPGSIGVASTGAVTAVFPSNAAITAVCAPTTCNPAPINVRGTLGTGVPITSNSVQISSPGRNSNYIWVASPSSPYFVPIDLSTGTIGNPIKLPYQPNSMVIDQGGNNLYFGSYRELMIYNAVANTLTTEVPATPGVVLAVSPNNTTVLVNDQLRGVFYLYSPATTSTSTGSSGSTTTPASYSTFGGIGQRAAFTPDGQTLYIVGQGNLYIYNTFTGWSVEPLPSDQGGATTGLCPANNSSTYPNNPNSNPPNTAANPNNRYNIFCSPDLAVSVPGVAAFLSGSPTAAYGYCPNTTVTPVVNYPLAGTIAAASDHVAATTDGKHILGATANPPQLTDISVTIPINGCPTTASGQTTGFTLTPAPTFNQISLAQYGLTNIDQVVASTDSSEAFITYSSNATAPPAGGALLPVYKPATDPANAGTLTNVTLAGSALAPIAGIFSPDNTLFFASTTGDNQLHVIDIKTLTDTLQINPKLTDINGTPVAPVFLAVKPRSTT